MISREIPPPRFVHWEKILVNRPVEICTGGMEIWVADRENNKISSQDYKPTLWIDTGFVVPLLICTLRSKDLLLLTHQKTFKQGLKMDPMLDNVVPY